LVNQNKVKNPWYWKKWRESGAVETIEDAILRIMQVNEKQKLVCVSTNQNAPSDEVTAYCEEYALHDLYTPEGRPKKYSYGMNGKRLFGARIPYGFQIESVPKVGQVVFRQGGTDASYHSQEGPRQENQTVANVAGVLLSDEEETDEYGCTLVPVALFDKRKDRALVEKTKEFLREKGVSGYIAFQS